LGKTKSRHFNGHLFEESTVFELTEDELRELATAGESDWQFIEPSIMGTLFERALEPEQRSQLGAHYTSEEDIKTQLAAAYQKGARATPRSATSSPRFRKKLSSVTVLDPACGSGNSFTSHCNCF
jgi:hypothetical protein